MFTIEEERTRWFMRHVLPHERVLRAWLSSRRSSLIDVDDVIQETYTAIAARPSIADIRHPRAYLFQVARSVVVHHARRSRIVSIQAIDDLGSLEVPDEAPTPEQVTLVRDELRALDAAIASMPDRTREAFVLRRVHDLSQREIATRMRLSESTVEKHIANGVQFLINWSSYGGNHPAQASKELESKAVHLSEKTRGQSRHRRSSRRLGRA